MRNKDAKRERYEEVKSPIKSSRSDNHSEKSEMKLPGVLPINNMMQDL